MLSFLLYHVRRHAYHPSVLLPPCLPHAFQLSVHGVFRCVCLPPGSHLQCLLPSCLPTACLLSCSAAYITSSNLAACILSLTASVCLLYLFTPYCLLPFTATCHSIFLPHSLSGAQTLTLQYCLPLVSAFSPFHYHCPPLLPACPPILITVIYLSPFSDAACHFSCLPAILSACQPARAGILVEVVGVT